MDYIFPIPRLTESFFDKVMARTGGRRLSIDDIDNDQNNADYLMSNAVLELKLIEEEALLKQERQDKIKQFFCDNHILPSRTGEVDLDIANLPDELKSRYTNILVGPIKGAVKKAAKQIKASKTRLNRVNDDGILLIANNGYASLEQLEFDKLVLGCAKRDTSQIDFVICTTVAHHRGDFKTYVFITSECYSVRNKKLNQKTEEIAQIIKDEFCTLMDIMMKKLTDPSLWKQSVPPVTDVFFEADGVRFVKKASEVPDSRFTG